MSLCLTLFIYTWNFTGRYWNTAIIYTRAYVTRCQVLILWQVSQVRVNANPAMHYPQDSAPCTWCTRVSLHCLNGSGWLSLSVLPYRAPSRHARHLHLEITTCLCMTPVIRNCSHQVLKSSRFSSEWQTNVSVLLWGSGHKATCQFRIQSYIRGIAPYQFPSPLNLTEH